MLESCAAKILRTRRHRRQCAQRRERCADLADGACRAQTHRRDLRPRARRETCAPLVAALQTWLRAERAKLSRHAAIAKAIDYTLTRWPAFTRFLGDGRICLTNNAAEQALHGLALGRKCWLFAGSQRGAERAAVMYTLIQTAKLNDVDPQAWLADVLKRIADLPQTRLAELPPWNWRAAAPLQTAA